MALAPHATTGSDRRPHDRRHRTAFAAGRPAPRLGHFRGQRSGQTRFPKHPEGDRVLLLASPPPSRGRGHFSEAEMAPAALWREMMGRWLSP